MKLNASSKEKATRENHLEKAEKVNQS